MKKTKPNPAEKAERGNVLEIDQFTSTVSMLDLDRNKADILARASVRPISVHRYGRPYVWIVPHEAWLQVTKLADYVPNRHPLLLLNRMIDQRLKVHAGLMRRVRRRFKLTNDPNLLVRALMLQALYSVPTEGALHDQLTCNMLYRWFVGMSLMTPMGEASEFSRELREILECDDVVELIQEALEEAMPQILRRDSDFKLNSALVRAWGLRHPRLQHRVPEKVWNDSHLFLMPTTK